MRLAPTRDLPRLAEPADVTDIDPGEAQQAAFEIRSEGPFAGEFLADGEGDGRHRPQLVIGGRVLASNRLLDEHQAHRFNPLTEVGRLGGGEAVVEVDRKG